ncbi:hypothetical protein U1Q18_007411, partial [Sarracenia purpurea var. burkii]
LVLAAGDFWISDCIQWYHLLLMAICVADSAMSCLNMLLSAAGSFSELWVYAICGFSADSCWASWVVYDLIFFVSYSIFFGSFGFSSRWYFGCIQ